MSDWRMSAACRGMDVSIFFTADDQRENGLHTAIDVCNSCPVRKECLDDAVRDPSTLGIRGGLTTSQRRAHYYATGVKVKEPPPHGTYGRFRWHQRMGVPMCGPCETAGKKYLRDWRLQRSGFGRP